MMNPPSLRILKADASCFPSVLTLISACRDRLLAAGIHQWDGHYPAPETVSRNLAEGNLYVAEMDGHIVGTIALDHHQEPEYRQISWRYPAPSLVIHRLCVAPTHQGQGLGSALMRFADQQAMDRRCNSLRLDVYSGNPQAVNLYQHLGYRIAGQFTFPSRRLPFCCMEKGLHPST